MEENSANNFEVGKFIYELENFKYPMYANLLDYYDNPTYRLTLYMAAKDNAKPEERIILAQTGVTRATIDNLSINFVPVPGEKGFLDTRFKFTVTQPGTANFMDQIVAAQLRLNLPVTQTTIAYLEIVFLGYEAEDTVSQSDDGYFGTGGRAMTMIAGPYLHKIYMTNITVRIDGTGSQYEITASLASSLSKTDSVMRIPVRFEVPDYPNLPQVPQGQTAGQIRIEANKNSIKSNCAFLQKLFNEYLQESVTGGVGSRGDEIYIDLCGLLDTDKNWDDMPCSELAKQAEKAGITSERLDSRAQNNRLKTDFIKSPKQSSTSSDASLVENKKFATKPGITIYEWFKEMMKLSPEFAQKVSRLENINDPANKNVKDDQAFINWLGLDAATEILAFDRIRNTEVYRHYIRPYIRNTARTDVGVVAEETRIASDTAMARRMDDIVANNIRKGYYYYMTGLNDQIMNLDVTYNKGITHIQAAGQGAFVGAISVDTDAQNAGVAPADADLTGRTKFNMLDAVNGINLFKQYADDPLASLGLRQILGTAGVDTIKEVLRADPSGRSLPASQLAPLATAFRINQAPAANDTMGPIQYTPTIGGNLVYSESFETVSNGVAPTARSVPVAPIGPYNDSAPKDTGSYYNIQYGYLARQQEQQAFMQSITMKVRGDPWYLGQPGIVAGANLGPPYPLNQTNGADYRVQEQQFFLQVRNPRVIDPDDSDEDSSVNTGYVRPYETSESFSGIYTVVRVTCEFTDGVFTCDVTARREIAYSIARMRAMGRTGPTAGGSF